jgi:hypothetical protein
VKHSRMDQVERVIDEMVARPTFAGRKPVQRRRVVVQSASETTPLAALFGSLAPQVEKGVEFVRTEKGQKIAAGALVALAAIVLPKV